jgi:HEAT repeat protein
MTLPPLAPLPAASYSICCPLMARRGGLPVTLREFFAPVSKLGQVLVPLFRGLDRALVGLAALFGALQPDRARRFGQMTGVFLVILLVALLSPPLLSLLVLLFGYVGVLAVGRAWVANEKLRVRIVKKLADGDPDALPDLRWSALWSALQLVWVLPLLFDQLQREFHLFRDPDTHFLTWLAWTFDAYSRAAIDGLGFGEYIHPIVPATTGGKAVGLLKTLTVDYLLIQGFVRLFAIAAIVKDGVGALRTDPEMSRRVGRRAVLPLEAKLGDPEVKVRAHAALVLGQLGDVRAVEPLARALADPSPEVRVEAAHALGALKDVRAIEPLTAALRDPDLNVRTEVGHALVAVGGPDTLEPLLRLLSGSESAEARAGAAKVLGRVGGAAAVEPLSAALRNPDEEVSRAAAEALGQLKDPRALEPLARTLDDAAAPAWLRYDVARALEALGDWRAVPALLRALQAPDPALRRLAAQALGVLRSPEALPGLLQALDDEQAGVREAVAETLGRLGEAAAVGPLTDALADPEPAVREAVAEALGRLKGG